MKDSPLEQRSLPASGCGGRPSWVVDLASGRVVRAGLAFGEVSSGAEAFSGRPQERAEREAIGRAEPYEAWWAARPPRSHTRQGTTREVWISEQ